MWRRESKPCETVGLRPVVDLVSEYLHRLYANFRPVNRPIPPSFLGSAVSAIIWPKHEPQIHVLLYSNPRRGNQDTSPAVRRLISIFSRVAQRPHSPRCSWFRQMMRDVGMEIHHGALAGLWCLAVLHKPNFLYRSYVKTMCCRGWPIR